MTGALWAAASGIGFGLFQSFNRRAVEDVGNPYVATFIQLVIASVVLGAAALLTEDFGQLGDATTWSLIAFTLAGIVHFLGGWTFLNLSQERIGAARTGPLLTMTPLFGLVIAAVTVGELPSEVALVGITVAVLGAYVISRSGASETPIRPSDAGFAMATALMWSLSPIFTVEGLEGLHSPLLGVLLGMVGSAVAYWVLLTAWGTPVRIGEVAGGAVAVKLITGTLVALATWGRWIALDFTAVAVVLALNMLAVPVVLVMAPIVAGRHLENVTLRVWIGALLLMSGSLVLIVGT